MAFYNDINSELNKLLRLEEEFLGKATLQVPKNEIQVAMERINTQIQGLKTLLLQKKAKGLNPLEEAKLDQEIQRQLSQAESLEEDFKGLMEKKQFQEAKETNEKLLSHFQTVIKNVKDLFEEDVGRRKKSFKNLDFKMKPEEIKEMQFLQLDEEDLKIMQKWNKKD